MKKTHYYLSIVFFISLIAHQKASAMFEDPPVQHEDQYFTLSGTPRVPNDSIDAVISELPVANRHPKDLFVWLLTGVGAENFKPREYVVLYGSCPLAWQQIIWRDNREHGGRVQIFANAFFFDQTFVDMGDHYLVSETSLDKMAIATALETVQNAPGLVVSSWSGGMDQMCLFHDAFRLAFAVLSISPSNRDNYVEAILQFADRWPHWEDHRQFLRQVTESVFDIVEPLSPQERVALLTQSPLFRKPTLAKSPGVALYSVTSQDGLFDFCDRVLSQNTPIPQELRADLESLRPTESRDGFFRTLALASSYVTSLLPILTTEFRETLLNQLCRGVLCMARSWCGHWETSPYAYFSSMRWSYWWACTLVACSEGPDLSATLGDTVRKVKAFTPSLFRLTKEALSSHYTHETHARALLFALFVSLEFKGNRATYGIARYMQDLVSHLVDHNHVQQFGTTSSPELLPHQSRLSFFVTSESVEVSAFTHAVIHSVITGKTNIVGLKAEENGNILFLLQFRMQKGRGQQARTYQDFPLLKDMCSVHPSKPLQRQLTQAVLVVRPIPFGYGPVTMFPVCDAGYYNFRKIRSSRDSYMPSVPQALSDLGMLPPGASQENVDLSALGTFIDVETPQMTPRPEAGTARIAVPRGRR
ncbi:MAG: hypothetical protein LBJ70_02890 [Holosporales bacterium]|jgi:hypothetical protein|nr:hypothetical protein [Holosporales bacterium]